MKGTPLTEPVVEYLNRMFPAEDALLAELKSEAEKAGIPPIQISPEQGAFMQVLLRGMGARRVIEIGTLAGYSAIIMGRALPEDGRLVTVERDPFHAEFARGYIEKAGLAGKIEVRTGAAADVLERELQGSGPYDFAFIDADKPGYTRYLELILPMMRPGGLIAGDNALAWGRIADELGDNPDNDPEIESVRGMQNFNKAMADNPRIQACLVPVGDGMCIGTVLG